ncbi:MAG TPA: phenylalanine--tRNA ligase subunit beta [Candidatus Saccharimonadales bacterium]|nr:phenylalanine--tRNA ligase subunit beta [Candidatus Saccharimonadales bacterium]
MKVSLNSIIGMSKRYGCSDNIVPNGAETVIEKIGAQLGAVEEVIDVGEKYRGITVAKVISCVDHPNADKLHVCIIDDGGVVSDVERDTHNYVQVVCGAPNVREGLLVAWLPPGTTVPSSFGKDVFVLDIRELRGVKSNGMLASAHELDISDDHTGILEISEGAKPGDDFAKIYELADDHIIDIENKMFTHRPDCFGFLGVAREIAGIQQIPFKSPEWYQPNPEFPAVEAEQLKLEVNNELPELVPRFAAIAMRDVSVQTSPIWLQVELSKAGLKSINNIVDYTNFFMLETGQPLHIYDYDKLKALDGGDTAALIVRHPKPGEKITLLNGKEIEPRTEAIMIATEQKLIGIGGVMGGAETEVDKNTKNIVIECATFDMYSIRRTSMAHGLFTDAVTRFTKGQSPLQNLAVLAKIVDEIRTSARGKVASSAIDINHVQGRESLYPPVPVSPDFINARLGIKLSPEEMSQLLQNVEFKVEIASDKLTVTAPFWRTDIEIPEDIVEELGRLYGYDKLPLTLPKRSIAPIKKNELLELKSEVRDVLSKAGANEALTYSFVHGNLLDKVGQDKSQAFQLSNALSPDLQYYRLSLTASLLDKVHANIKAGYDRFVLFEIGKGHNLQHKDDDEGLPSEFEMLELVVAASDSVKKNSAAFYVARKYLINLAAAFNIQLEFRPFEKEEDYPVVKPYDHTRSAQIFVKSTGIPLGMIGEYKQSVHKNLKLPDYCAGFGIGLTQLLAAVAGAQNPYMPLPRFPKVTQDICLKVKADLSYQKFFDFISQELNKVQPKNTLPKLRPLDIYQRDDDKDHKQVTLRLTIASYERTMTDAEVAKLLDSLALAAKDKFGAERI